MTALVGILNKRAVVLAADSALTVTRGEDRKIYNNTTKIFNLSQDNHMAVMFFNSADFMGTPWDVIFKLYRGKRGKKRFAAVKEYAEDFYTFLASKYFCDKDRQRAYFESEFDTFCDKIKSAAMEDSQKEIDATGGDDSGREAALQKHLSAWLKKSDEQAEAAGVNPEFEDYSKKAFTKYAKDSFADLEAVTRDDGFPQDMTEDWLDGFFNYIRSKLYYNGTGIIFAGYGDGDIFPTLLPTYVSGAFDSRLRYYIDFNDVSEIGDEASAYICPFAQSDVMMTLMKGIAPEFLEKVNELHLRSMSSLKDKIADLLEASGVSGDVIQQVKDMETDSIDKERSDAIDEYMQSEYIDGIVDAVDSFSVQDMAIMAENLVSITSLQRHFSSSDETVGGPIDVAVITCPEGFRWVKRKDEIPND